MATTSIFKFHMTFVMNYITWNAIVSGYPNMTADKVGLINQLSPDFTLRMVRCMIKYAIHGFRTLDQASDWVGPHDCHSEGYCSRCIWKVSDRFTMRFAFRGGIGEEPDVVDGRVTWRLNTRYRCGNEKILKEKPMGGSVAVLPNM